MKLWYMYVTLCSTLPLFGAQLSQDLVPLKIVHKGKSVIHSCIYDELLSKSGTLSSQIRDLGSIKVLVQKFSNIRHAYYDLNYNLSDDFVDYLCATNKKSYLQTLSLVTLIHIYQEADFWALVDLPVILTSIVCKLQNKQTLDALMEDATLCTTFIHTCNDYTKDSLVQSLVSSTHNFFWSKVRLPIQLICKDVKSMLLGTDDTLFIGLANKIIDIQRPDGCGRYKSVQTLLNNNEASTMFAGAPGILFARSADAVDAWKINADGKYKWMQTLLYHTDTIRSIVYKHKTLFLLLDNSIQVWGVDKQGRYACIQTLTTGPERIKSLKVISEHILFTLGYDNVIKMWERDEHQEYVCVQELVGESPIEWIQISLQDRIFSVSDNNTITVWNINSQCKFENIQTLQGHTSYICDIVPNADGKVLFSASIDGSVKVWKVNECKEYTCTQTLLIQNDLKRISLVIHNNLLFVCIQDKGFQVWGPDEHEDYTCIRVLNDNASSYSMYCDMNNTGTLFTYGARDIALWSIRLARLELEHQLLINWLRCNGHDVISQSYLKALSKHVQSIYESMPQSIQTQIIPWYEHCSESHQNVVEINSDAQSQLHNLKSVITAIVNSSVGQKLLRK
ncbi:hypothetical protein J120_04370 [candidate division TM6 bacterium JCVI TM6SC1]|uniref:Uncharacterized protein n=1 Tax=candidate division TM6 bacterium JCVI TM6SC1 TaxID=1306947 RepID=A0A0D2I143_9BACT|nr:hypothetical protein J120_04370 [candidate division TM6 bacterium JCVI TM6SC1]